MARRSQCSSAGDNPLDPNYLPPHYREEYRLAIDALVEEDLEGYYQFLQKADVVDFLSTPEIDFIQHSVQAPKQSGHLEQPFLESVGDGSSDTYWPIHSDLDVPGLDLGWPQLHPFIGPTEVTTLVNPPEPDMPSIKEQARRLIKNAQQVIAIVMDMFTDVDMFADIVNAAMRNVAVYILLDEQNAHHFINMVSNCRVNLQSIQFLRVRTVSGITYQCRSGKSFKGQMMDRFLLTDCRAVLSGNYSFMWSFEKLHRCMAHLFLGQLVTTFDEEFRILFAQSQPLMIENVLVPVEEFGLLHKRQYANEKASFYREPRKFLSQDIVQPDEWARHSYDERMDGDWRMMALKKQESLRGPGDMYRRHATQQQRTDPCFDQGPSRMPIMENPAYKRHSYAEGVHDRYSSPFLQQQGMPDTEVQGKYFHKGQQPFPGPGPEPNYGGYDKFWNQDYQPAEQYSEPGLPQELQPSDNFDPVLNYLSSTRNLDFDQSSEKLPPTADLPLNSSHPRRLSFGQPYVCQSSPTPSNSADQQQVFQDPTTDRKDPTVKRGLRNWRISSYLSTYENPGEEGLPMVPPQTEAFEDPPNPIQQTVADIDLSALKIPNVREFKVPAVPRVSQMLSYAKTKTQEQPKKPLNEPAAVALEIKTTPTPSESSSTAEREKAEATEQKELKTTGLLRDDSFRRKYNAALPRSSRLRSSLIFSSLEQQQTPQETTSTEQPDEQSDRNEAEPTKLPFVSHVLGQRRSAAREPFEWSRYVKSATFDNSSTETSKPDDESSKGDDKDSSKVENSKDTLENPAVKESFKPKDVVQDIPSPSVSQSKPSGTELPKTEQPVQPPKPLIKTPLYMDMSDPDNRLMFFKELAAKRKAAKATEAAKSKEKGQVKPPTDFKDNSTSKKEEPPPNVTSQSKALTSEGLAVNNAAAGNVGEMVSTEACKPAILPVDASDDTSKKDNITIRDPSTSQNIYDKETKVSADSDTAELDSQSAAPVTAETEACQTKSPEEPPLSSAPVKDSCNPPTPTNATTVKISSLTKGTDESPKQDSASKECPSVTPSSVAVPLSSELDVNAPNVESVHLETNSDSLPLASELNKGTELSSSNTSVQSSSSDQTLLGPASQSSPTARAQTLCSKNIPGDSSLTLVPNILFPNVDKTEGHETVSSSLLESSYSVKETSQKSANPSSQTHQDSVPQSTSSETPSAADSALVASGISSDTNAGDPETKTLSLQCTTKCEEFSATISATDGSEKPISRSENDDSGLDICSSQKSVAVESQALGSPKADSSSLSLSTTVSEMGVLRVSGLESSVPTLDLKETMSPVTTPEDIPPQPLPSQTSVLDSAGITPCPAQSETAAPSQDTPTQATTPHDLNLTDFDASTPAETISCSTPLESDQSDLFPETKKTETNKFASDSLSDKDFLCGETQRESEDSLVQPLTHLLSCPTEATSKSSADVNLPCKASESDTPESYTSEPALSGQSSKIQPDLADTGERKSHNVEDTNKSHKSSCKESVGSEQTSDQVKQSSEPTEITSKQPKLSQSRYHSSTANVLSSSNLRDDTKLLLEQISANCQSRNEATKESPVTDDEKEDEADKNAKKEKETGFRTLSRGQPKSTQEREKLLERIQSMRKERKVYSRFEMAP